MKHRKINRAIKRVIAAGAFVAVISLVAPHVMAENGEFLNIKQAANASPKESRELQVLSQNFFTQITKAKLALEREHKVDAFNAVDKARSILSKISETTDSHPVRVDIEAGRVHYTDDGVGIEYFFPVSREGEIVLGEQNKLLLRHYGVMSKEDISIANYKVRIDPKHMSDVLNEVEDAINEDQMFHALTILGGATGDLFILQETEDLKEHP